jgi:peptide/nickel transport system permease protein
VSRVRVLESLPPGLGHLRRGFRRPGWLFLGYFAAWLLVVVGRPDAVRAVFAGVGETQAVALASALVGLPLLLFLGRPPLGPGWVLLGYAAAWAAALHFEGLAGLEVEPFAAAAFLVLVPVLLVLGAHKSLGSLVDPPPREGMGTWALAWRAFKKRPRGVAGLTLLGVIYGVAILCPVLAPYGEEESPRDTVVNQYLPPGATVYVFGDPRRGEVYARDFRVEGEDLVIDRAADVATGEMETKRIPLDRLGEPRRGWSRGADEVRTLVVGERRIPYREDHHLLGTDALGRDLLSRILYGSRISLSIGFLAMAVAVSLGTLFGALAGWFGGWVDGLIMRLVDILLAFPRLVLLLLIITIYPASGIFMVVVVLGLTGWMGVSRLVRAQVLQLKELDFTSAARAMGFSGGRIVFRHLIPNSMAPVIVAATLRVGDTILVETALSFLGMGVKPPTPTWGNIVNDGSDALRDAWWIATLPGLAIVLAVVCFNLVGDALRDALDPRQRF